MLDICDWWQRLAEHKVQRVRYHKYKDVAFNNDFCSGPAEVLSGGMAVRKPARSPGKDKPLTCFVGTKSEHARKSSARPGPLTRRS